MERDAPSTVEVLPPIEWAKARKVGTIGLGLCGAAAILGLVASAIGDAPSILHTARLWLVFAGAVTTGVAVSLRPDLVPAWLLGAAAALLALFGTPAHWDSFRLVFGVLAAVAVLRAALIVAPPRVRIAAVSAFILLHFFGILLATTSPNPTPWMVHQLYNRAYEPYLRFVYLRNAYHFYAPEPGPASLMVCLVKTEDGQETGADGITRPRHKANWIVLPRRADWREKDGTALRSDVKDPLGVTYFRRLSLTDAIAHQAQDMAFETFEKSEIRFRRHQLTLAGSDPYIPWHPLYPPLNQYRQPAPHVSRYYLPSYAQHILMDLDLPDEALSRTTVKIYRVEHRTLDVGSFIGLSNPDRKPGSPYHPTTYLPFFLGEYGLKEGPDGVVSVQLLQPREPMLYWLVPVVARPGATGNQKDYDDYFSVHAGVKPGHEFDWSQLR